MFQTPDENEAKEISAMLLYAKKQILNDIDIDNHFQDRDYIKSAENIMSNSLEKLYEKGYNNEKIAATIAGNDEVNEFLNNPKYNHITMNPFANLTANVQLQNDVGQPEQIEDKLEILNDGLEETYDMFIEPHVESGEIEELAGNANISKAASENISAREKLDILTGELESGRLNLDEEQKEALNLRKSINLEEYINVLENKLSLRQLGEAIEDFERNAHNYDYPMNEFENLENTKSHLESVNDKKIDSEKFMDQNIKEELEEKFSELKHEKLPSIVQANHHNQIRQLNKKADTGEQVDIGEYVMIGNEVGKAARRFELELTDDKANTSIKHNTKLEELYERLNIPAEQKSAHKARNNRDDMEISFASSNHSRSSSSESSVSSGGSDPTENSSQAADRQSSEAELENTSPKNKLSRIKENLKTKKNNFVEKVRGNSNEPSAPGSGRGRSV
jgi:hypothetical protein